VQDKTWFTIDGTLEPINFPGPSFFRFPLELAELVVDRFSNPSDWVLDPFCGFGTTLVAAQNLGRQAIGFEKDPQRGAFAAKRVVPPSRVLIEDSRRVWVCGRCLQHIQPLFSGLVTRKRHQHVASVLLDSSEVG